MSLRVLAAGTHSLVVDGGRPATRGLGVPVGGPADHAALMLGNALVGNPSLVPALEITLGGPTLMAETDVGACVFGAPFRLDRDGEPLPIGYTFTLQKGQTLHVGGTPHGCRAYLCVPGGFRAKRVLDSCTAFAPVRAGDVLECQSSRLPARGLAWGQTSGLSDLSDPGDSSPIPEVPKDRPEVCPHVLRCLPGPQADWFDDAFYSHTYRVIPASNRMGVRLDGPPLVLPKRELVSEPVAPGAIQVTNDGKPIVLGVDGQTIGGYPKVAHVIAVDLDALGQLRPGAGVRFQLVQEQEAEEAAGRRREELARWLRRIAVAVG
ncbi:MAG TPA: biotin-dependent carboxyltransferase family protein [Gemmataceae bacterium]|nr:biotin-dependent carboxyltransferase family protein [Gemmataceae bacterium]